MFFCSRLTAVLLVLIAFGVTPRALAQGGGKPAQGMTTAVDCRGNVAGCDADFFQTEIGFTRFVRDFSDADVYVLITAQKTGGGGQRADLIFQGKRGAFAGRRDTMVVITPTGSSADDERRAVASRLALGLAGFAGRAGLADRIRIGYDAPTVSQSAEADLDLEDPWNHWVFRVSGEGSLDGQKSSTRSNVRGSFTAERVTEEWKLYLRPSGNYRRNVFDLGEDGTIVNTNSQLSMFGRAVVSLSDHWSTGLQGYARRSTFDNIAASGRIGPAIEYNVFPYRESTRRQLRLQYEVQGEAVAYVDTTTFGRISQRLLSHEAGVWSSFAQPWGSTNVGLSLSQYITLPDKYRASVRGSASMRLTRGLNVNLNGSFSYVRDQISLQAGELTAEEILTQQRQQATNFDYSASLGLSYTFGSIFNQVVNARFGGG
jgi:hypothetical protein